MIHVVLDTNILHQEGLFSRSMQLLGRLSSSELIQIYVPELVKKEHLSKRASEAEAGLKSAYQKIQDLIKKTDRNNDIYNELNKVQTSIGSALKKIAQSIDEDFEIWRAANKVNILDFDPGQISSVFDDYFNGKGVFRQPKHRDDIPDAFINLCIQRLLNEKKAIDVVIKDGTFRTHLQKTVGITIFDGLESYMQTAQIAECIALLDKRSERTETLKAFFSSSAFASHLTAFLVKDDDLISDIYLEDDRILGIELIGIPDVFGFRLNWPVSDTISNVVLGETTQIADDHFSTTISFIAQASISYCASFGDYNDLPAERQSSIDFESMDGRGICDLSEDFLVSFTGHVEMRFDAQHATEVLISSAEYLDSNQRKIQIELDIVDGTILEFHEGHSRSGRK